MSETIITIEYSVGCPALTSSPAGAENGAAEGFSATTQAPATICTAVGAEAGIMDDGEKLTIDVN